MFSANYRVLGAKIQYHRKIKGLTQQQLAGAIGISTNYLSAIERGVVQGYQFLLFGLLPKYWKSRLKTC